MANCIIVNLPAGRQVVNYNVGMNRFTTSAIIIARTDYGDADRIYTFITPDHGKVQGIAKGVKKPKSRLAGGLQLFSICKLTFLVGKGEIRTIISTQLEKNFTSITKDLKTTNAAYDMLKIMSKLTHEHPEPEHFQLLSDGLESLDIHAPDFHLSRIWFLMHFLRLGGHAPNFDNDTEANPLEEGKKYYFDADAMQFRPDGSGGDSLTTNHIKLARLAGALRSADSLYKIENSKSLVPGVEQILQASYVTVHRFQLQ